MCVCVLLLQEDSDKDHASCSQSYPDNMPLLSIQEFGMFIECSFTHYYCVANYWDYGSFLSVRV